MRRKRFIKYRIDSNLMTNYNLLYLDNLFLIFRHHLSPWFEANFRYSLGVGSLIHITYFMIYMELPI